MRERERERRDVSDTHTINTIKRMSRKRKTTNLGISTSKVKEAECLNVDKTFSLRMALIEEYLNNTNL